MSGQFNKGNFEQNPSNLKKKRNNKGWDKNNDASLCDEEILNEKELKAIKEDEWIEKHVPKPTKKELKYKRRIIELENSALKAPLSKKESKELKKLNKKYKKLYNYRHRDLSSNHTAFKCCLTAFVVVVVLACTAVFGGYHFIVQPYTGVTLFELTDIVGGIYNSKEAEKNITQVFDPVADSDKFFATLQESLYLDKAFTLDDLLHLIPTSAGGTGDENASASDLLDMAKEPVADENTSSSLTGNAYLDELLSETKFDFSSLKNYDGSKKMWEVSDKMVAAVMQQVIMNAESIPQLKEMISKYNISIKNSFIVRQCLIRKNQNGETTMQLTLQVKAKTLVEGILKGLDLGNFDFVKSIVPLALPQDIYVNAVTTPQIDKKPVLGINSIDNNLLQTLLTTVDAKAANGKIEEIFNKVGNTIFSAFNKITEIVGADCLEMAPSEFDDINGEGKIKFDILQTAMRAMKVQNVTSSDFLLMIKHLHSLDYKYDNIQDYIDANIADENLTKPEDFVNSKNDLFASYGISSDKVEDITPDNFIDKISTIPELINIKDAKIGKEYLYTMENEVLKNYSCLTDNALAQIMNKMVAAQLGDSFKMEIKELTMNATSMDIIAQVDVNSLIDKELGDKFGTIKPMILSIFPKNMFIKVIIPYERKAEGVSCDMIFNYTKDDSSKEESDKMFETIAKLMASINGETAANKFDKNNILSKFDNAIYPTLESLKGADSKITIEFKEGKIQLPTIFEVLATTINDGASESDKLSAETIQQTMASYYTYDSETTKFDEVTGKIINNVEETSLQPFINHELKGKFFIAGDINENSVFDTLKGIANNLDPANIKTAINIKDFQNNTISADKMNLAITSLELAHLIIQSNKLNGIKDIGCYTGFTFVDIRVNAQTNKLSLVMAAELNKNQATGNGIKIENFAADYLVVQADVNLSDYTTTIKINNANDENINTLLKIVNKLTGSSDNSFDASGVASNVSEAIKSAFDEFETQGLPLIAGDKVVENPESNNRTDGFTSTNIYKLVNEKSITNADNRKDGDDELLRSVIYKLNNLHGQINDSTGHLETFTERVFDPLKFKDADGDGVFDADGKYTVTETDGSTREISLLETDTDANKNQLKIFDNYIGQQIKAAVDNSTMNLIKFAIFSNQNNATYETFIDNESDGSLGIESLVPSDLVSNAGDKGVMFLHFRIAGSEIGGNAMVNTILPNYIYCGAFVDLTAYLDSSASGYKEPITFINNLNAQELDYINRLMLGESTDQTAANNIGKKLDDLLASAIGSTFTIDGLNDGDGNARIFQLSDLFNEFTLTSARGNTDNKGIGMLVKDMPVSPILP